MDSTLEWLEGGYARRHLVMYALVGVDLDDECQEERCELVRTFGHGKKRWSTNDPSFS